MSNLLLRTVHGSRLYNFSHDKSDYDYYEVYVGKGKAKQTIVGEVDTLRISYDSFMLQCQKGVPQALEALWSPVKEVDKIPFISDTFNACNTEVYKTYMRTIRNFWSSGELKRKRHAIRLCINLSEILDVGYLNPSLSKADVEYCNYFCVFPEEECPGLKVLGLNYTWQ